MNADLKAYDWNELEREVVRRGVTRVGFGGDNVICVFNWLEPGMETRPHSHSFEQLVLILQGRIRLHLDDQAIELSAGGMIRISPEVIHYAEPLGEQTVLNLDIFSPVRVDYAHLVKYQLDFPSL
jgi:quercetin dioxygenase-like cupin family protein